MNTATLVSGKHKVFGIPFDAGIANLVPEAKQIVHPEQGRMLLLPHTRDTTRLARNMGYQTPAPILSQYDWAGDAPWRTQRITAALLTMHARAYVLSEMGTGKTRGTLHAANHLLMSGEIRKALVAAPLSTLVNVWDNEIFRHFQHLRTAVLHGSRQERLKRLRTDADIYIINHDGIETILGDLLARTDIDLVIIDELACYRNARSNRWKAANLLVNGGGSGAIPIPPRAFAWGLTGSPTPNEPADAWAQVRLLTPSRVPRFYKAFKRMTMTQLTQFKWIPRPEANDVVFDAMQPAVRYTRDDCSELPDVSVQTRAIPLSALQKRVYGELVKKLKLGFQEGTVTAANEGVLFNKLLQIASGFVYTNDKRVVDLQAKARQDALLDILDEAEGKVIVFAEFVQTVHELQGFLQRNKIAAEMVTGSVPAHIRNHVFQAFQNAPQPRVLVAHPRCMAHGLTLTAANVIVWYTPSTSLETYEQACARITRYGQTRKSLIMHLTGTPVETKLYKRLQQKASTQGALLEMFESQEPLE